jgi:formate dehydrogenase major subunit
VKVTRRQFLKMSGALGGYLLTGPALWGGGGLPEAYADVGPKTGTETTTICCFCGVGCGALVTVNNTPGDPLFGKVVAVEGDPVHPINEGTLCSKGQAQFQTANQLVLDTDLTTKPKFALYDGTPGKGVMPVWPGGKRLARVLYRPANGTKWRVVSWDWAMDTIAQRITATRAANWEETSGGMTVNRTRAIAALGGAAHDNQECYLMQKLWRGLGLVWVDHQARI